MDDYELLDAGNHRRLEVFGEYSVDRPALSAPDKPGTPNWMWADLDFGEERGWTGPALHLAREDWVVGIAGLRLRLRPANGGQVGVFPEHAGMLPWLIERVQRRDEPQILNLFAYTGLTSLALARAGAAVAHVDAARSAVSWARENAVLNDMQDRPVRWLVDDARAFTAREVRRGRRYDGVVLDPPTYGHGPSARAWQIERDLPPLLDDVDRLLAPDGFLLLTAHTGSLEPFSLGRFLGNEVTVGELALDANSGVRLRLGAFARLDRGA